jgi:hypothetical protein
VRGLRVGIALDMWLKMKGSCGWMLLLLFLSSRTNLGSGNLVSVVLATVKVKVKVSVSVRSPQRDETESKSVQMCSII